VAETILKRALEYGIHKSDIVIDCLALTVSADQKSAMETLKAIKTVKEKLGLSTILGVSNISFGLPARDNKCQFPGHGHGGRPGRCHHKPA